LSALHALNADLHCHSTMSDGALAPNIVAQRAAEKGVQLWALTDHDELAGLVSARAAALERKMKFVSGVEISVTWASMTIHIVGLGIDESSPVLAEHLRVLRSGRDGRGQLIGKLLEKEGIPGTYEGALTHVSNPSLLSRTHFARHLVKSGVCRDTADVFSRYLAEGKPGYVPHEWAKLSDAVSWILDSGGVAIVAHPGRYKFRGVQRNSFFEDFKTAGGTAIEVVSGSHTPDQYDEYAKIAKQWDFLASRGSDFHSPTEGYSELGSLPPLPRDLEPVWERFI
jgi:3',5'-nucleoside bisphosphate phosphatase